MKMMHTVRGVVAALFTLALTSCTTSQADFAKNPKAVDQVSLCRTYLKSQDPVFQQQIMTELAQRGVQAWDCPALVKQQENQVATAIVAVALIGGAVAYCSKHYCGGGSSYQTYTGNCQYNWQRDAAGNRCGNRSAAARPGGW